MILVDICIAIPDVNFEYLCIVLKGEVMQKYLDENPDQEIYELSENILYHPNYFAAYDNSTKSIPIFQDSELIKSQLEPLQKELEEKILCSTLIHTPDKLKKALKENPRVHLKKVRSSAIASPPASEEFLPIFFMDFGNYYLGWQHPAILLQQYDLAYGIDHNTLEASHESKALKLFSNIMYWKDKMGFTQFFGEFLVHKDQFEYVGHKENKYDDIHIFIPFSQIKDVKVDRVTLSLITDDSNYAFSVESFKEDPRKLTAFLVKAVNAYRQKRREEEGKFPRG